VLSTSRSVGDPTLKMERAYVDKKTGKVSCCWSADNEDKVAGLFEKANVSYDSITQVEEAMEGDFM
jgi:hypothetical protein